MRLLVRGWGHSADRVARARGNVGGVVREPSGLGKGPRPWRGHGDKGEGVGAVDGGSGDWMEIRGFF